MTQRTYIPGLTGGSIDLASAPIDQIRARLEEWGFDPDLAERVRAAATDERAITFPVNNGPLFIRGVPYERGRKYP